MKIEEEQVCDRENHRHLFVRAHLVIKHKNSCQSRLSVGHFHIKKGLLFLSGQTKTGDNDVTTV